MIGRDVFHIQRDSLSEIVLPTFFCFIRQSVYKVNADIAEPSLPASADGFNGSAGIVAAFQQLERVVIESLYPHAKTVERERRKHFQIFGCQVVGIGFQSDFLTMVQSIMRPDGFKYQFKIFLFQLRRSSATEINGFYIFSFQIFFPHFQLLAECLYVA